MADALASPVARAMPCDSSLPASGSPGPCAPLPSSVLRRMVLHSDMNCFYANVECQENPELRDKPVVVGGNEEARHGIVLAKNQVAKRWGIQTAETLMTARRKCPDLVVVPPNYRLYLKVSRLARQIYCDYTDQVEPFGPDEAWLDITGTPGLSAGDPRNPWSPESLGAARIIAAEISERVKAELGLTVSVGASWNKIFAKFGSDYKKPDAITFVTPGNYRNLVWEAPVRDLLYVGPATERKLAGRGIGTIGQLAQASDAMLKRRLGKPGLVLKTFACGLDATPVRVFDAGTGDIERLVKSYGNGLTAPHDIECRSDAKTLLWLLSESVAQRLREGRAQARTISVGARLACDLSGTSRQTTLERPTDITAEIAQTAWRLLTSFQPIDAEHGLRGLHVRASGLVPAGASMQAQLFDPEPERTQMRSLDRAIDALRSRFGNKVVVRGVELCDPALAGLDIKDDNIVHPESFFR